MDIPVFSRRSCLPWLIEIAVGAVAKILYRVRPIGRQQEDDNSYEDA